MVCFKAMKTNKLQLKPREQKTVKQRKTDLSTCSMILFTVSSEVGKTNLCWEKKVVTFGRQNNEWEEACALCLINLYLYIVNVVFQWKNLKNISSMATET